MTGDLDHALVEALAQLVEATARHNLRLAQVRGVAPIDLRAVCLVDRAGELRPGQLARALGISSSGTSTVIRRLVAAGFVHRDRTPDTTEVRLLSLSGAVPDLGLAPDKQVVAVCDHLGLDQRDRETIVAFAAQTAEMIDRQTEGIRRHGLDMPLRPRWS